MDSMIKLTIMLVVRKPLLLVLTSFKTRQHQSSLVGPNMLSLVMLLACTLSILTAATQALDGASLYTMFPSQPEGDVLNVTRCYCQSPVPLSPGALFGYYVRVLSLFFLFQQYHYPGTRCSDVHFADCNPS